MGYSRAANLRTYLSKAMKDGPRTLPRKVKTAASIIRARGLSGVMDVISPPAPAPVSGVPQSMRHVARALKSPPANEQEEIEILNNAILSRLKRAHLPKCSPKSLTIIVPFYHTKTEWADDLISSLNRQTDHDFEFIAVFDGSQPGLEAYVTQAVRGAYRFQSVTLETNQVVSAATNAGIDASRSDYIVSVDHDDTLSPVFVESFRFASAATDSEILYADEAITEEDGRSVKSVNTRGQFDLRHYLSQPYIVHPIFIQRELAIKAGRLDETMRVSHDVDFMLRCVAEASRITAIPLCLYYWRTSPTSLGHQAAEHVMDATTKSLRGFVDRKFGWPSQCVQPRGTFNTYSIYPPLDETAKVAILIPTKNHSAVLRTCIDSILSRAGNNRVRAHIFVIDHDSTEPELADMLESYARTSPVSVIPYSGPWNYSAINNYAIGRVQDAGEFTHIVLMNNDIEIKTDDWLDRLMSKFSFGDVGTVGACLLYSDDRVQHGGVIVGLHGAAEHSHKFFPFYREGERYPGYLCSLTSTRDYDAVTAALLAVRIDVLERVGFLDEKLAVGFNDTDLCLRIGELGLKSCYAGDVIAYHYESLTRGTFAFDPHPNDSKLFVERHADRIDQGDRHYGALMDWDTPHIHFSYRPQKDVRMKTVELAGYYQKPASTEPSWAADHFPSKWHEETMERWPRTTYGAATDDLPYRA